MADNIQSAQESSLPPVPDQIVKFKMISDRDVMEVISEDTDEVLIEISGYDLDIKFNMKYLHTVEDIEAAVNGVADLFRKEIMSQLLSHDKQDK